MEGVENPARRRLFRGKIRQEQVLRLPWVVSEKVFTDNCSQCQKCISACETKIIIRDDLGFPKVDFSKGECTFCEKCTQVCEEPLFVSKKQRPWPIELSISDKCLAKNLIYCQSCRDECEVEAINFSYFAVNSSGVEQVSSIPQPILSIADCSQCGACISSCPQDAISVTFLNE